MTSERDPKTKQLAELLDSKFKIPGTDIRFGIDPLLGLFPGVGDWVGGIISLYFMFYAVLLGSGPLILGRMLINILLDILAGTIPVFGDVFDVYWKANERNARILEDLKSHPNKTTSESRFWIWSLFVQSVVLIIGTLLVIGWVIARLIDLV